MKPTPKEVAAGQAVYTKRMLSVYDVLVLGFSNRYVWRCPTSLIESHYDSNVSSNHLDVGVGTGYFLDRCRFPTQKPRVALMDLNANSLRFASRRIARYRPETYQHNVLEEISPSPEPFDSVGINYLLHCIPGAISEKALAFDHLRRLMNRGARLFGSTILHHGVERGWLAQGTMRLYNKMGIFSNSEDSLDALRRELSLRFENVEVDLQGCVALFAGHAP